MFKKSWKKNETAAPKQENVGKQEKKQKSNATELVFILDRSGSMSGLESDTVGGFNATIEKQKKLEGEVLVTTYLFDDTLERLHDRVPIQKIKPLTEKEYWVRGCTALLDAIGEAITHIDDVHRYLREEDVPAHTMFVITTDGMENASRRYDNAEIRKLVEDRTKEKAWEFLFLGANMDAFAAAEGLGIRRERAANFSASHEGLDLCYCAMSDAITSVRKGSSRDDTSWRKALETENEEESQDTQGSDDTEMTEREFFEKLRQMLHNASKR